MLADTNFHLGATSGVFRLWNGDIGSGTEILRVNKTGGVSWDDGANFLDDYEEGTWTPVLHKQWWWNIYLQCSVRKLYESR